MSMEYCVQVRQRNGVWSPIERTPYKDISTARRELGIITTVIGDGSKLRIACREVGEWSECQEAAQ